MFSTRQFLSVVCAAIMLASAPSLVFAQEAPAAPNPLDIHEPTISRPSIDTTPVSFSVGGIRYMVPRNYLTTMDDWKGGEQKLVTMRVNIPDLHPFAPETTTCFTEKDNLREKGCDPFEFEIESTAPSAAAIRGLLHGHKPAKGPYGYEKYEADGFEYYRKTADGRTFMYACQIFDNEGKRDGICEPLANPATGPRLHYFFELRQLEDIDQIDASLRNLAEGFTVGTAD